MVTLALFPMYWTEYLRLVLILGIVAAGVAHVQREVIPKHAPGPDATAVEVAILGVHTVGAIVTLPLSEPAAAVGAIVLGVLLLPYVRPPRF